MNFTPYIWNLYKNSPEGQQTIKLYENLNPAEVEELFDLKQAMIPLNDEVRAFLREKNITVPESDYLRLNLVEIFAYLISLSQFKNINEVTVDYQKGVRTEDFYIGTWDKDNIFVFFQPFGQHDSWTEWVFFIENITFGLYCTYPEFYIPYRFLHRFNELQTICDSFNIPLPEVPAKRDKVGRIQYYAAVNYSFYEFRQRHNLSPAEMCAFLYDFALKATQQDVSEKLPEPLKAWLLIGNKLDFDMLDQVSEDAHQFWSGNVNTRPGDICIMYCKSPRSYIHSIWRAASEGFNDPLFYYQNSVYICSPILTKPVTFREMKADPYLSQTGHIRSKLQGASGKALGVEFYEAILKIMEQKGQDISILPRLPKRILPDDVILNNERDVEENLLEPLLKRLDYSETDWIRQMPVRMGRGERNYPDYAIGAKLTRGEEAARMLVEAKFRTPSIKILQDAYFQAKSYALRLQSDKFMIASAEGVWLFINTDNGFNFEHKQEFSWDSLSHPDSFHELYISVGKPHILGG